VGDFSFLLFLSFLIQFSYIETQFSYIETQMINNVFIGEKVLEAIKEKPGISTTQIAERFDISRVTAFRYIRNLVSLQKVRIHGQGKATRYFPHESLYIASNIATETQGWNADQVHILKEEVLFALSEAYGEKESVENFDFIFEKYCMYVATDDTILTGFNAFLGWCTDPKHNFSDRIVAKAMEYLDIIGSIEVRRKKYGFLDGTESARTNLNGLTEIAFDRFLFSIPSVLENGFGRTRTAIELYYGKLNNKYLLTHAIEQSVDNVQEYARNE
jgi:Winged helix-turn-helix DNA-binding